MKIPSERPRGRSDTWTELLVGLLVLLRKRSVKLRAPPCLKLPVVLDVQAVEKVALLRLFWFVFFKKSGIRDTSRILRTSSVTLLLYFNTFNRIY